MKILVIENDYDTLETMVDILKYEGHDVVGTPSGEEGVRLARGRDLVFLDLGLDNISGWEVAKAVRSLGFNMPIYVITGQTVTTEQVRESRLHVNGVFKKPVSLDIILDLVEQAGLMNKAPRAAAT